MNYDMNHGLDNGATVVARITLRDESGLDRIMAHWPKGDGVEYIVATHRPGSPEWMWGHYFRSEGAAWKYLNEPQ